MNVENPRMRALLVASLIALSLMPVAWSQQPIPGGQPAVKPSDDEPPRGGPMPGGGPMPMPMADDDEIPGEGGETGGTGREETTETGRRRQNSVYRYAMVTIHNETQYTMTYTFWWNGRIAKSFSLKPGSWRKHYWPLACPVHPRWPTPCISFDNNQGRRVLHTLTAYKTTEVKEEWGNEYSFMLDGRRIYLRRTNL